MAGLKSDNRRMKEILKEITDSFEQSRQQFKEEMAQTLRKVIYF